MTAHLFRTYGLPLLLLIAILVAWDLTKPRYPVQRAEPSGGAQKTAGPAPPWNVHENIFKENREHRRKEALQALDQAWSSFCQKDGRERLVSSLTAYFSYRDQQEKSYPARWGDVGRKYIVREWTTADDKRIERLTQEIYARGYLNLRDFRSFIAERIARQLNGINTHTQPCAP